MTNPIPAEGFPPGEYLWDEMVARNWAPEDLVKRMGGDGLHDSFVIGWLLAGLPDPRVVMSRRTAEGLERALGTSAEWWLNLDRFWREWLRAQQGVRSVTYEAGTGVAWTEAWQGWGKYLVEERSDGPATVL